MSEPNSNPNPIFSEFADDADMLELVELFVEEMPRRLQDIEKAARSQDLGRLAMLAHQLKGSAGGYGFPSITEVARRLEVTAKAEADLVSIENDIHELSDLIARVRSKAPKA